VSSLKEKVKDILERILWLVMFPFLVVLLLVIGTLLALIDYAVGRS